MKNIEQGRGSSARRLCHRKRVKRVPLSRQRKPPRPAVAHPRAVPGIPGPPPRPRLQSPPRTKEAQCPTRLPNLPRKRQLRRLLLRRSAAKTAARRPLLPSPLPSRPSPPSRWRLPARVEEKKVVTQRQGFKANEFVGLSRSRRWPDPGHRGAGDRRREARAVRHQLHQGQDDAARADRQGRQCRHAQAVRARRWSRRRSRP